VVAELVFSTSSFCPLGLATPDVPILVDAQMRYRTCMRMVSASGAGTGTNAQSGDLAHVCRSALRLVADLRGERLELGSCRLRRGRSLPQPDVEWHERSDQTPVCAQHDQRPSSHSRAFLRLVCAARIDLHRSFHDWGACSRPFPSAADARAYRCARRPTEGQRIDGASHAAVAACLTDRGDPAGDDGDGRG
jgi:hypothetical protein